jgi:hypothetical protein
LKSSEELEGLVASSNSFRVISDCRSVSVILILKSLFSIGLIFLVFSKIAAFVLQLVLVVGLLLFKVGLFGVIRIIISLSRIDLGSEVVFLFRTPATRSLNF